MSTVTYDLRTPDDRPGDGEATRVSARVPSLGADYRAVLADGDTVRLEKRPLGQDGEPAEPWGPVDEAAVGPDAGEWLPLVDAVLGTRFTDAYNVGPPATA